MRRRSRRSTGCGRSWGLSSDGREGQTFVGESLLVRYANFVKLPHTVFALPFALLGVVVASRQTAVTWRMLGLVVLAFTCARFVALGFNRIADRELDARNPRTQARELPTGRLTLAQAWIAVALAAALFLGTARALNPLCFALAPIALVFISAYSYTKRFTAWSHLWLGLADGIATPAGYLAVTGRWSEPWWLLPVGALAVTLWVGGFDVFYALPDEGFDRAERLESLVVRLGPARAIFVAKLLHGLALVTLVLFGIGAGLGVAYYVGVTIGVALIAWEHQLVKPGDLARLDAAFFGANGLVSVVVFLGALVDRIAS
ncbi:MAG: 4-hydroxybenzoate polyprenyltransferase [Gemmatimonadetes bacterium]|nr:MAG: 4-hydroxybenzoate polyprenyltransferase [Gemmatimonadota bacterium]